MDKRNWPWKKKNSDKTAEVKSYSSLNSGDTQDASKVVKYVQISTESYAHLTELESEVKDLNAKISYLNDKLLSAQSEMTTKDNLVKQHSKVAEEAVSGWEKAEAETLALKHQLESTMLLKLTAEDRASHLDAALKECMKQVRNVKEESEQKLHDVVFAKTEQWEYAKAQLEANINDHEQELQRLSAENDVLSRSLQERCNMLMKMTDEKSQADAEIEVLKNEIQTCQREINSLKYELHVASKEVEIRNEEKNMSVRSAEVANKQHLEDVKRVAKLEAECQRLRSLVRKKLPGPAALAQMKLEVDNFETPKRRHSLSRSSSPHSDFSLENAHQCRKENEFLTTRLLTMEEEMKMLKEALSMRNNELQASRNKLANVEAQVLVMNQHKSPTKSIKRKSASLTSMSEDGIDEATSCSGSSASAFMSENVIKVNKADSVNQLELMDDFLEMEKLACLPTKANEVTVDETSAKPSTDHIVHKELKDAILLIHEFVSSVGKESAKDKIEDFSSSVDKVLYNEISLHDFIVALSYIFSETTHLDLKILNCQQGEGESSTSDCVDKVTLLENKVSPNGQTKEENLEKDLAKCQETLQATKIQVDELKLQLDASEKSNSLAETQLKCMTESYKSLESRKKELENEVHVLQAKEANLVNELQEEKHTHQEDLIKYKELQEKIESECSVAADADVGIKNKQGMEIAAAAEKLAECQETIFHLCKQLNGFKPSAEPTISSSSNMQHHEPNVNDTDTAETRNPTKTIQRAHDVFTKSHVCSDTEIASATYALNSKRQKQRSSSSSSLPNVTPEKHGRGFSRFFSKGRSHEQ